MSRHYVGGFPWDNPGQYLEQSPIHNVTRVKTPILFIHAEGDRRCPISQAEEYFTALVVLGKEAVLVRYPGDTHTMPQNGRPSNRVDRLDRTQAWFRRFLG